LSFKVEVNGDWERRLQKVAADAVKEVARGSQRAMDGLRPGYADKPIDEIKSAVRQTWRRAADGDMPERSTLKPSLAPSRVASRSRSSTAV